MKKVRKLFRKNIKLFRICVDKKSRNKVEKRTRTRLVSLKGVLANVIVIGLYPLKK